METGRTQLQQLVTPEATREQLATALDVTPQAVARWLDGSAKPTYTKRLRLQELYSIPMDSWDAEEES